MEIILGILAFSIPSSRRTCISAAKSFQSCPTLCDPIDGSPPGSPVPGILQARTLKWVAISFSNAWKWKMKVKRLSCVRLSNPMDYSLPASSVHGIFQARVLGWGAIAFSDLYFKKPKIQPEYQEMSLKFIHFIYTFLFNIWLVFYNLLT